MSHKRIKERTYLNKLISFIVGLVVGYLIYLFIFSMFTNGDEIPDFYSNLSIMFSLITMLAYIIISEFNYLKKLELTTNALHSNISIYKKREKDLLSKAEEIITKFLYHESDIQKSVASSREGSAVKSGVEGEILSISDLRLTVESYPDLKSDTHISTILSQLEESQNTILNSKLLYNEYVTYYNSTIVNVPAIIFLEMWKLESLEFYHDTDINE
ncbi:LemA family protein [Gottschalkia acidurici 9a]|uniref:LemA family protein n=1 Tax=Gottschalkia acidurici (strain ATCC 7906 / DSM 604 / BCRC 14475 / CIP 104303 / KCTC 5404 / NCIMB 10678 / 9a) TaxID=1128398 RepID=K0B585_GOTA9|nr:LemA family protein [Gottschalkia acidurici]AFS79706.1 LemA family protein [Gottschalkia acidurici 9a]